MSWLESVPQPDKIQKAFLQIIHLLTEVIADTSPHPDSCVPLLHFLASPMTPNIEKFLVNELEKILYLRHPCVLMCFFVSRGVFFFTNCSVVYFFVAKVSTKYGVGEYCKIE